VSAISSQLFEQDSTLKVREVTLSDQDSLQSYREKLARIILDELYHFVGLLDAKGMTLEINRPALEGAGINLSDIQDKPFWEARWFQVSKEITEKQRELCRRAAQGEFLRCDLEVYGKSSGEETIIVDFSIKPVRDYAGNIVFLLAEGRNITEKKAAEAEIARKNEELQKLLEQIRHLDQLKSDLFANVSHELRTPLALILGPAESVLASGANLTDVQRRDLGVIRHNATTLLKHVNDLLDLAKLDAGKMTMDYVDTDVARMVRTVAAHFDALAPQKSISYAVLAPDVARAEVDPEKMERVLLNLLSNAFKFTPHGGRIQCTLKVNDGRFTLAVQDSGPGIPRAMRNTIFERFRQAQGGTTREFGGTGLGLSIVKDFVDLHGGTVSISDAPTGGTLVQVNAPLHAPEGSSVRTMPEPESVPIAKIAIAGAVEELRPSDNLTLTSGDAGKTKILVIEDHPDMRRFIAEVLSSEYHVITAADGLEGLSSVAVERPDLVVTDLMMPKLGGDELVRGMRKNKDLMHLPVLVLSARADDELRLKLLAELVQDYLVKPFSAGELRARVRNLVTMKQTRDLLQQELASQTEDVASLTRELIFSKRTLQESLKAERTLSALVENSHDFIGFASPQGQALFVNPAGRQLVGLEAEQVKLTVPRDYIVEDDHELLRIGMASALEKGNWEGEMRFRNFKTGAVIPMFMHLFDVKDTETGRRIGLATISRDITLRKHFEEGVRQAQAERAHVSRLASMGELTASIAHEVNQPLTAVTNNGSACLRLAANGNLDPEVLRRALEEIVADATRASAVISRIRAFIKKAPTEMYELDINNVVQEVLALADHELQKNQVLVDCHLTETLPHVRADRVQLQQVLLNLVINGVEAMTGAQPRTLSLDSRTDESGNVLVAVRDSGTGFGSEVDRLFTPFFTTKGNGMGMGLAISRSLIENHGGRLWATANSPQGAVFSFTLPPASESHS
jgi:PAS domain S-box-containing protein